MNPNNARLNKFTALAKNTLHPWKNFGLPKFSPNARIFSLSCSGDLDGLAIIMAKCLRQRRDFFYIEKHEGTSWRHKQARGNKSFVSQLTSKAVGRSCERCWYKHKSESSSLRFPVNLVERQEDNQI